MGSSTLTFGLSLIQLVLWMSFPFRLPQLLSIHTGQRLKITVRNQQAMAYHISSKSIEKFEIKTTQKLPLSHTTTTLNEGTGHSNCYQYIQFSGVYHQTKFERNRPVNVPMQANAKALFDTITDVGFSPLDINQTIRWTDQTNKSHQHVKFNSNRFTALKDNWHIIFYYLASP